MIVSWEWRRTLTVTYQFTSNCTRGGSNRTRGGQFGSELPLLWIAIWCLLLLFGWAICPESTTPGAITPWIQRPWYNYNYPYFSPNLYAIPLNLPWIRPQKHDKNAQTRMPMSQVIKASFIFAALWFLANYVYRLGLVKGRVRFKVRFS